MIESRGAPPEAETVPDITLRADRLARRKVKQLVG